MKLKRKLSRSAIGGLPDWLSLSAILIFPVRLPVLRHICRRTRSGLDPFHPGE